MRTLPVIIAMLIGIVAAAAADLSPQKSTRQGVTVTVVPQSISYEANTWDFNVTLDTHSGNLSDDLAKSATLLDAAGNRYAPLAWEGAAPGGHHRTGTLKFTPISPTPETLALEIQRPGEASPRTFQWQIR